LSLEGKNDVKEEKKKKRKKMGDVKILIWRR